MSSFNPLRSVILAAAGNDSIKRLVAGAPMSRSVVQRFVAGESTDAAVATSRGLVGDGLTVTLDYLGEDTTDQDQAERTVQAYLSLLDALHAAGLLQAEPGPGGIPVAGAEVSVKLSAVGQALDERLALENASRICAAAEKRGTTVTLDMEDHTTTDSTLRVLGELRRSWSWVGAVVQAYLRRTESDCRELASSGSRVRLCKGAYAEPSEVAYSDAHDVDRSYVRCANALLEGKGYPMFATHDPRLVSIVAERARWLEREPGSFEYQMLHGVRPGEQRKLVAQGDTVRVYVPYGDQWYGYLMRRMAERPANAAVFLRSLVTTS